MKFGFATLAATLLASGCAERAPRSFVQPNVIKKSDLQGTWYYVQTVTDAPPTSTSAFNGLSSELMKIRFDVQEGVLYARRAYEQILDSEDAYQQDPKKYAGMPVAAWKIESQFDIIREYNSTTGEESNKIIESEERPWNEREFIRVDWSEQQVTDYVGIGLNLWFDGVKVQSVSYWESDPSSPDALHMERAAASDAEWSGHEGEAMYLDLTNKMVLDPDQRTECFGDECVTFPACFFYYSTSDCASQVIKVRHAFSKVAPLHDYEPRRWDGKQMDLFGIWDVGLNRLTYNRQYGVTNSGFKRHAARFNLWKKSYNEDGTLIPHAQRELRTIPYYASSSNGTFPPELFETGREVVRQWNEAVKVAVKDITQGALPQAGQEVFVWCHNPVKLAADENGAADPAVCAEGLRPELNSQGEPILDKSGNQILKARQGDPRRSHIFWVNQQQDGGPLGYGPPLFDIETGETMSGQAYIYGGAIDTYSARSRDLVLLVTGKLDSASFVQGANVREWVVANRAGVNNLPQPRSQEDIDARARAMDFSWAQGAAPEAKIDRSSAKAFIESMKNRDNAMYKAGLWGTSQSNIGQTLRDSLRGTDIEARMVTSDIVAMGGNSPKSDWASLPESEKYKLSPLRSKAVTAAIEERMDRMRALGVDFADFADEGIAQRAINLASDPAVPNMDPEAIRQKLRKDIFLGVTLHEMGHNVGLRHNFRASFDALNYFPKYWELRDAAARNLNAKRYAGLDANGQPIGVAYDASCATSPLKGKIRSRMTNCPGGATSVDEVIGGVREYQYSSIMDYGNEFNSDFMGLGKYDKAAMKFSYAGNGFVEVFTKLKYGDGNDPNAPQYRFESVQYFSGAFGFPSPLNLIGDSLTAVNYYTYPDMFQGGISGFEEREDVPFEEIADDVGSLTGKLRADSQGRPMVPYFFCSDEFVGNLTCQRFDSGADAYEQAQDLISRYHNYYLINNFKRDRYAFTASSGYGARIAGRYFDMLREQMTWYTLLRANFAEYDTITGNNTFFTDADNGWGTFTVAVSDGFDLFGRVISTPSAGSYKAITADESTDTTYGYWRQISDDVSSLAGTRFVPMLQGKYGETTWDFEGCGYYWAEQCQSRIGYLIDKRIAMDILSQSQAYFTGRDTSTDVRRYAIGYIRTFKHQIEEKIGALLATDYRSLAPQMVVNADKSVTLKYDSWTLNDAGTQQAKTDIVDPYTGFTLQLDALVYGLSEFPTTYDQDFVDTTRIFVLGNGESPVAESEIAAKGTTNPALLVSTGGTAEWMQWRDPVSGKTYVAHASPKVSDGSGYAKVYRKDTGARMLGLMADLYGAAQAACGGTPTSLPPAGAFTSNAACMAKWTAAQNFRDNIDLMRGLHKRFGYARP